MRLSFQVRTPARCGREPGLEGEAGGPKQPARRQSINDGLGRREHAPAARSHQRAHTRRTNQDGDEHESARDQRATTTARRLLHARQRNARGAVLASDRAGAVTAILEWRAPDRC